MCSTHIEFKCHIRSFMRVRLLTAISSIISTSALKMVGIIKFKMKIDIMTTMFRYWSMRLVYLCLIFIFFCLLQVSLNTFRALKLVNICYYYFPWFLYVVNEPMGYPLRIDVLNFIPFVDDLCAYKVAVISNMCTWKIYILNLT